MPPSPCTGSADARGLPRQSADRRASDLTGDSIIARLSNEQVDVSTVMRVDGATSSLSSILIDRDGERLIVNYRHPKLDKARPARGSTAFSPAPTC